MTREEAIVYFESLLKRFEEMHETETSYWGKVHTETTIEAIRTALTALQPVSREQVEKVWPGCEACKDAGLAIGEVQFYGPFEGPIDVSGNMHYCPNCGRPITPVARDRQGKRLEALKDGKGD
ncbi:MULTISPECIES: hypothetical protein [Clostridium]|uniref:hypothetical protein n=1 Tax=Clostridium TaxID=1485 RepID=UPI00205493B5|nr:MULTISPECIES: hypothetical protein [Clostridium]MCB5927256.1 hypothetical protein [bacterium 210820-DFI.5.26]MCQ5159800.1 hypothetical protein [Clostridium sp. DFI.5.61]DAZ65309.1 MAG TPA: DNA-directed RNA polymerase [Caudoviricetes sp.]